MTPNFTTNAKFSSLTTTGVGGPIKYLAIPKTEQELEETVRYAIKQAMPYYCIGGGSNIIASDKGVDFLIIQNKIESFRQIDATTIDVSAGTPLQTLVNYCIKNSLSGLEKLTGIPGTVGGAVYGNAGAFGQNISDTLTEITTLKNGKIIALKKDGCQFAYKDSIFKHKPHIITRLTFKLQPSDAQTLLNSSKQVLEVRLKRWPKGIRCPGSFFKNIEAKDLSEDQLRLIPQDKIIFGKVPAGYLLEAVGAKGKTSGGVTVSNTHANAFINQGRATATDYWNLAKQLQKKVFQKFGITLEPEVQLINLPPL